MLKLPQMAPISHASKVMLKILQARLQGYVNCELPDVQAGFRKGRGTRDQIANIHCFLFLLFWNVLVAQLCQTLCNPMDCSMPVSSVSGISQARILQWVARLLCPWDFPSKNTGVSCHLFLQGIFETQGLNPSLLYCLHCRHILYQ